MDNINLAQITRKDFPIFSEDGKNSKRLIYLDHAATSQKPSTVIESLKNYYSKENANVHRGAHQLSAKATEAFEAARVITANFIDANSSKEIIYTRNATESINLVAHSWGESNLKKGDEIIISLMEHHSNIVPWQLLAKKNGCIIRYIEITPNGELDLADLKNKITNKTKILSIVHISNALGTCNSIREITEIAHSKGVLVMVDACQSLAHQSVSVKSLNIDFLAGSAHKLCGPTGIGFLWSREEILEDMSPFLGGGEMIQNVFLEHSDWADLPYKFEAGTPAIGEAIGMGKALNYLKEIGLENIKDWEKHLTSYLFEKLKGINQIQLLGPSPELQENRGALATFVIDGIHSNDIATLLDQSGICIRSGHHCCQPLHRYLGINSSVRASMSFTTEIQEIDYFIDELKLAIDFIKKHS